MVCVALFADTSCTVFCMSDTAISTLNAMVFDKPARGVVCFAHAGPQITYYWHVYIDQGFVHAAFRSPLPKVLLLQLVSRHPHQQCAPQRLHTLCSQVFCPMGSLAQPQSQPSGQQPFGLMIKEGRLMSLATWYKPGQSPSQHSRCFSTKSFSCAKIRCISVLQACDCKE